MLAERSDSAREQQYAQITQMEDLWPLLKMDEKRWLLVRPLCESDVAAAQRIGRTLNWLTGVKRKAAFSRAREIRNQYSNAEIARLIDADLLILMKANVAVRVESQKDDRLDHKEEMALMRLLTQRHRNAASSADDPANDALPPGFFDKPSWAGD